MDLTDFLVDASTPESDQDQDDTPPQEPQSNQRSKGRNSDGKIIRRRARKACVECHKRKVRCDVLSRGQSCTNCRLDGLPCVIRSKDGRKKSQFVKPDNVSEAPAEVPHLAAPNAVPGFFNPTGMYRSDDRPAMTAGWQSPSFPRHGISSSLAPSAPSASMDMIFSYYGFLEAEPLSHIPPEDFKFLEHKGCFHLPSRTILDEFLWEYFLHVHPVLPILDERQFWDVYLAGGRCHKRMSLFLFRAMLFVSCSFVSLETIKLMGFVDTLDARATLYRRAKFLYDFDATSDPLVISQGALLLTYYSSEREPLANTSWLRIAIQFATSERVHLYYTDPNLTPEERLLRKRLWWCCVLRDRILPLGVRRPIQITRDSFDFSQEPISEADLESEFNYSQVYDSETKRSLARILKAQIDLAIVLTDMIALVYPINSLKSFDYDSLMRMPATIQQCRESLDNWFGQLLEKSTALGSLSTRHKSVSLFHGLTQVYYYSARAAMCQYESFALQASTVEMNSTRTKELGSELHSAIASISNIVGKLVEIDVARFLPVSAVAYMALPIILNSIDLQSSSSTTFKNESKRRQLRLYNEAMEICHARYSGTGACVNVINKTIAFAKADIFPSTPSAEQHSTSTALLRAATNKIDDWFEVFVSQPRQYLRIALTIDISLCMGRYPQHEDFPRLLLMDGSSQPCGSIPRALTPVIEDLGALEAPATNEDVMTGRRKDLDYFDFGTGGKSPRSPGTSAWNGDMADSILEDVLRTSFGAY